MSRKPRVLLLRPPGTGPGPLAEAAVTANIPVIDIEPIPGSLEEIRRQLERCDWLVVTSPRAPRLLAPIATVLKRLQEEGRLRIAAVGPKTLKALTEEGLHADHVPKEYRGAALAEELARQNPGCVLLARSEKAVPELPQVLRSHGIEVVEIPLYRVAPLDDMAQAAARIADMFDYVVFTSPSIAEAFTKHYRNPSSPGFTPIAIGPTTAKKLAELGYPKPLQPRDYNYTIEAVAHLIIAHWEQRTEPG